MQSPLQIFSVVVVFTLSVTSALVGTGCVQTQFRGRDISRHAEFRDAGFRPSPTSSHVASAPPRLKASVESASADEVQLFALAARDAFDVEMQRNRSFKPARGQAELHKCRLRVVVRRRFTFYVARCRASWTVNKITLVEVEAEAKRRVSSQAITEDEAKEIRRGQRNPLMLESDARVAMTAAATLAAKLLGNPDAQVPLDDDSELAKREIRLAQRPQLRAIALLNLKHHDAKRRMAGAIDLFVYGRKQDAKALAPLLRDSDERVRVAAAATMVELVDPSVAATLFQHRTDENALVRRQVEIAVERLLALHPRTPVPPLTPPPVIPRLTSTATAAQDVAARKPRVVIGSEDEALTKEGEVRSDDDER